MAPLGKPSILRCWPLNKLRCDRQVKAFFFVSLIALWVALVFVRLDLTRLPSSVLYIKLAAQSFIISVSKHLCITTITKKVLLSIFKIERNKLIAFIFLPPSIKNSLTTFFYGIIVLLNTTKGILYETLESIFIFDCHNHRTAF